MKSYKMWIKQFRQEDTPRGDMAREIKDDKDFPVTTSKKKMLNHLEKLTACSGAFRTFHETYLEYKKCLKKPSSQK
jgi:uncharacterized protein YozE (UPF0346 family)